MCVCGGGGTTRVNVSVVALGRAKFHVIIINFQGGSNPQTLMDMPLNMNFIRITEKVNKMERNCNGYSLNKNAIDPT